MDLIIRILSFIDLLLFIAIAVAFSIGLNKARKLHKKGKLQRDNYNWEIIITSIFILHCLLMSYLIFS